MIYNLNVLKTNDNRNEPAQTTELLEEGEAIAKLP